MPRTFAGQLRTAAELAQLERQVAEAAVVADLEECCPPLALDGNRWLDTRPMLDPREHSPEVLDMAHQALEYAQARLLIVHHPLQPHLVRVLRPL